MEYKIIDFQLENTTCKRINNANSDANLLVKLDNNTTIELNYIKVTNNSYNSLKENLFEETIRLINEIYKEHIKLNILGSGYLIYRLHYTEDRAKNTYHIVCAIIGFNTLENKITSYKLRSFVSSMSFTGKYGVDTNNIGEIILTKPIDILAYDETTEIKLTNIDKILSLRNDNLYIINYNIANTSDKTLTLSNLQYILLDRMVDEDDRLKGIEKIVILDTCEIDTIPLQLFWVIRTLREIVVNSKIKFIDKTPIKRRLSTDKNGYYIDANSIKDTYLNSQEECVSEQNTMGYKWVDPMQDDKCKWKHLSEQGANFLDMEIEFVKGELESDGVREYLRKIANDEHAKLTIAICLTQTHQAVAAGLYMPIEIYNSRSLQQIWVYQREAADIVINLSDEIVRDNSVRYQKLRPFGMLYGDYMDTRRRYLKAMLLNVAYDNVVGRKAPWPMDLLNRNDVGRKSASEAWKNLIVCKKM